MQVLYLRCDNRDERIAFKKACNQKVLGVEFEYTTPGMPQQNRQVEWKFTTLFNRVHFMLNRKKFITFLRNGLWAVAPNTATLLKNNLVTPNRNI